MTEDKRLDYLLKVADETNVPLDILVHFSKGLDDVSLKTFCNNAANLPDYMRRLMQT